MTLIDLFHPQVTLQQPSSLQTLEDIYDFDTQQVPEHVKGDANMTSVILTETYSIPTYKTVALT